MFGWFTRKADPAPAGLRIMCTALLPQGAPGQPAGFSVDVAIRSADEDHAVSRAISYLYAEGAADVRIDAINPMSAEEMTFDGDEAEVSGRIYFHKGDS